MRPLIYPDMPEVLRGGFTLRALQYFGAGAILASVTIGSGETLMASRAGAIFEYSLLWCILIAAFTKGIQVYTAARYFTLSGKHPLEHWAYFPGPPKWIPISLTLLCLWCFPFLLAFLTLILGEIVNEVFHVATPEESGRFWLWARIWATLAAVVAITLSLVQSYKLLEKTQLTIVGILLASIGVACLASNPDWVSTITGLLWPTIPEYPPWVLEKYAESFQNRTPWVEAIAIAGFIGGGTYDYLGYIGCLREKPWGAIGGSGKTESPGRSKASESTESVPADDDRKTVCISDDPENISRGRLWLWPATIDVTVSFMCVFVFSACFLVLGAAVLHPQQLAPAQNGELLTHQSQFLTRFHPSLLYLYQVGIFVAFLGTIYGVYEIYSRTLYECLRPLSTRLQALEPGKVRTGVLLYCGVFGIILCWTTEDPMTLITFPSLMGGVFTCGLWCFGMVWLDRRDIPRSLRMKPPLLVATVFSGIVLTALGLKALVDYFHLS